LHALRDPQRQGTKLRRKRVEWCSGAAAASLACARQPRAARTAGTEFRPGFGRHPDPALGPIALRYPLADFLPFIEGPPLQTPGLKTWGFFWPLAPAIRRRFPCHVTIIHAPGDRG